MKRAALVVAITIAASLLLAGCSTSYFFSFKEEAALGNDEGNWIMEDMYIALKSVSPSAGGSFAFGEKGLFIRGKAITCPFMFSGDLTYTLRFWLKADSSHTMSFGFYMANGTLLGSATNFLVCSADDVGGSNEHYSCYDDDGCAIITPTMDYMPGLIRSGRNVFQIKKRGLRVKMEMNGKLVADFSLERYDSPWFAPCIESEIDYAQTGDYGMFIESVKVTYEQGLVTETPFPI